ncbi:MAG: hypothetical protein IT555_12870 [Acetobacteraceae bacterium]|nr:hypothetical protein [Acetobacteraceae bacterium]
MACVVPTAFGTMTLDITGTLALAGALGVDPAAVAALLPDIRAGMMAGLGKVQQDSDRYG